MKLQLKCSNCGMTYQLPQLSAEDGTAEFDAMRVVSDPFSDGKQVWFWSEKENKLYLNLSCKRELDLVFLRIGQNITSVGDVQLEDVHVKWTCENCGEEMEINESIPCLVNQDTRIWLKKMQKTKRN